MTSGLKRPLQGLAAMAATALIGGLIWSPQAAQAHARHHRGGAHGSHHRAEATASLKPLSPSDIHAYAAAFSALRNGEFDSADAAAKHIDNPLLKGRLAYAKLMHPAYAASYDELVGWLDKYRDQPDADRVYALAKKRKLQSTTLSLAPPPPPLADAPGGDQVAWAKVEALAQRMEAKPARAYLREASAPVARIDPKLQAGRDAYYRGDLQTALTLADKTGDRWIGGLAAFRLKRYADARSRFAALAQDDIHDDWLRSAAAYWAARSAVAAGAPESAPAFLALAARTPYTFYGLIAERQLGMEPAVGPTPAVATTSAAASHPAGVADLAAAEQDRLARTDKRAARAVAYAQLGMKGEAAQELRAALLGVGDDGARKAWLRLGLLLNTSLTAPSDLARSPARLNLAQYPTPDLQPDGGFTQNKALIYALVRQESRFNADATSVSGAYGLMQLMPATAARVAGDDKLTRDPSPLKSAATNLRLGQDYVARLLKAVNGDLLQAVAAYNIGPGAILKTLAQLGPKADPLLLIESLPAGQTREFVEKVVAGYWIYRNLFGQETHTLDAAASAGKAVAATLDGETPAILPISAAQVLALLVPAH